MVLDALLDRKYILSALKASDKEAVLEEMVDLLSGDFPEFDKAETVKILQERENLGTTGIGGGIAIPHAKLPFLENTLVIVGRSPDGVDFAALDGEKCHIFFMVLAPEQAGSSHLRVLAAISRLLKNAEFCESFLHAGTADDLYILLKNANR